MKRSFVLSLVAHLLILAILAALYFLAGPPPPEPRMVEVELQAPAPPPPAPPPQPPSKPTPPQKPKPQEPVQQPQPPQPTPSPPPAPPPVPPPATDDNIVPVKPQPKPADPKPPEPPPPPPKQAEPPPKPAETPPQPPAPPVPPRPSGPPSLRLGADTSLGEIRDNGTGPSCKSPHNLYPAYPPLALQRGEKGSVKLRLHIDSSGDVILAEILESSGHPLLDKAAHDRLVTWHCNPATDGGAAVLDTLEIQINFLPE